MGTTNIDREPSQVNYRNALYILIFTILSIPLTHAVTLQVTAEYKPAPYDINGSKFINTTPCIIPNSGQGFWCNGTASLENEQAIKVETLITSKVIRNDGRLENAITYQKFTGEKTIELTKTGGIISHKMQFKLTQIGASQTPNYNKEVGTEGSYWLEQAVQGDCNYRLSAYANSREFNYFYDIKSVNQKSGGTCYNNNFNKNFTSYNNITIQRIFIGYKLQPPNPLKMENGTYKGRLTLSLGRNKDLDFGDATYSDSNVTIEFTLRVTHQLKVEFPAGSNKVILQPPKGWAPWINSGKTPPYLQAELPFRLWKSAEAYVYLSYCQYESNGKCQLKNTKKNHQIEFDVAYVTGAGERFSLTKSKHTIFNDGEHINIKRNFLFSITQANLTEMMKYPASTYQGDITIMFEAEIPPL